MRVARNSFFLLTLFGRPFVRVFPCISFELHYAEVVFSLNLQLFVSLLWLHSFVLFP